MTIFYNRQSVLLNPLHLLGGVGPSPTPAPNLVIINLFSVNIQTLYINHFDRSLVAHFVLMYLTEQSKWIEMISWPLRTIIISHQASYVASYRPLTRVFRDLNFPSHIYSMISEINMWLE